MESYWKLIENYVPFHHLYYRINLFEELQQVTEFSPAETRLPQAHHVNLSLIRSFIPLSGTDGKLRAVKYLGSPERHEERSSMVFHPFTNLAINTRHPHRGFLCGSVQGWHGYPLWCRLTLALRCSPPSCHLHLSPCSPLERAGWASPLSCRDFWSYNGFWLSRSSHHVTFNLLLCHQGRCHLFTWRYELVSVHFPSSQNCAVFLYSSASQLQWVLQGLSHVTHTMSWVFSGVHIL